MDFSSYTPERLQGFKARYIQRSATLSLGTVRDFCDSMDQMAELATIQQDLKDLQRPWAFKAVLANVPTGGRILEIGAGEPYVAELLSRCGYEVWVVDPYDGSGNGPTEFAEFVGRYPNLKIIRQQFGTGLSQLPLASFDAVYSISVLEHIPFDALRDAMAMAHQCLAPRGINIHAVDHVHLGRGRDYHLRMLELICTEVDLPVSALHAILDTVDRDQEVYLLSAEAHNRWRGAQPYDNFPMRRCISVQLVVPNVG